ncbi:DUF402 domain-containing protein [[Eubacterium] cellulosolvens]
MDIKPKVVIRGIYATALTKLLLDSDIIVNKPQQVIANRLQLNRISPITETRIQDRHDRQGIILSGFSEDTDQIVEVLKNALPDLIVREKFTLNHLTGKIPFQLGFASWDIEFTYNTKRALDEVRHTVKPTIIGYHLLKGISPERVDELEKDIQISNKRSELSQRLKEDLIYRFLQTGQEVQIEHVKPNGTIIHLVPGKIISLSHESFKVKRSGFRGRSYYDGINVPKGAGDYAITEINEAAWILKHIYYSNDGRKKGEMYNINTPIEIYPSHVRYVDLEVDVVRRDNNDVYIIDLDKLKMAIEEGFITEKLGELAKKKADDVYRHLRHDRQYLI